MYYVVHVFFLRASYNYVVQLGIHAEEPASLHPTVYCILVYVTLSIVFGWNNHVFHS